jgi:hypothetical protein
VNFRVGSRILPIAARGCMKRSRPEFAAAPPSSASSELRPAVARWKSLRVATPEAAGRVLRQVLYANKCCQDARHARCGGFPGQNARNRVRRAPDGKKGSSLSPMLRQFERISSALLGPG